MSDALCLWAQCTKRYSVVVALHKAINNNLGLSCLLVLCLVRPLSLWPPVCYCWCEFNFWLHCQLMWLLLWNWKQSIGWDLFMIIWAQTSATDRARGKSALCLWLTIKVRAAALRSLQQQRMQRCVQSEGSGVLLLLMRFLRRRKNCEWRKIKLYIYYYGHVRTI